MPIFLVPLIPFIASVLILNLAHEHVRQRYVARFSIGAGVLSLGCIIWLTLGFDQTNPDEYLFSPLFNLPGTSEALSFSLFPDTIAIQWLVYLGVASLILHVLAATGKTTVPANYRHISAMHLAQAGLTTLFLSGSLVTSLLGWGLTLAALILALAGQTSRNLSLSGSTFMILMLTVFLLIAATFLLYASTGHLSFSTDTDHLSSLLRNLINHESRPIVENVLNLSGFLLLLALLPGIGLAPFTSWLGDTRDIPSFNALFIYVCIMPAGFILLQRYTWFFDLTPSLRIMLIAVSIISLIMAFLACSSQRGGKLTLPWLAVSMNACLVFLVAIQSPISIFTCTMLLYPGFLVFGIGQVLALEWRSLWGRRLQITGIIIPFLTTAGVFLKNPTITGNLYVIIPVIIILHTSITIVVLRRLPKLGPDTVDFSSSIGWSAFSFFGLPKLLHYSITWPMQQIADGFWTLETFYNQFFQHILGKTVRRWGRFLWLFDCWFITRNTTRVDKGMKI